MEMKEQLFKKLEELFETDEFSEDSELSGLPWDSLSQLGLIAACDDAFGLTITGEKIQEFKTVSDILQYVEENKK